MVWRTTGASAWLGALLAPPRATVPTFESHVSTKAVCLRQIVCVCVRVCVKEREGDREKEERREDRRANVSNFLLVTCQLKRICK